jgi:G6PDH family F420-dependent oxidoreductase
MRIGYFLSCEEYSPAQLVEQAGRAQAAGFEALCISDHFHPWNSAQGQSPFVWSVIGAISQVCQLPVLTAVTCPTVRTHPAVVAQAAATSAVLLEGRFTLGVGSGEALNEHIVGADWPHAEKRLAMLEEAVGIIRRLFTGEVVSHSGRYFDVDTARLFTRPDRPPEIYVSAFGPKALETAVRIGDGFVTTKPDDESVAGFRAARGPDAPAVAALKVAYAPTREEGIDHAHRLWANAGLPGELAQVLPTPEHFEQASSLVTRESTASSVTAGNDARDHLAAFEPYRAAGFSTVYVANMGPHVNDMIEFYGQEVLPELRRRGDG